MNRYPGIRPFRQDERHLFFGRNADAERLLRLVRNEQVVVLYGKSGYGKSSLLNAGLYPRLQEEGRYRHWEVRFGPYKAGESASPANALCHTVGQTAKGKNTLFSEKIFGKNLWQTLKGNQAGSGNNRFILFFDQFEELFTYPPDQILAFRQQLAEALYNATPENALRAFEQSQGLPAEAERLLYTPFELKVVFSIRADRMSLLKQLEDYLPNLLRHTFLLEALDEKQATEAVTLPASLSQFPEVSGKKLPEIVGHKSSVLSFSTPPFTYAPATLTAIFQALRDDSGRIETSALQIVCKHVEDNIVAKRYTSDEGAATNSQIAQSTNNSITITPADLGDLKAVFRAFYDSTIAVLSPEEQRPARHLAEDVLIKDGIRLPFAEQALLTEPGVTKGLLEKLERASLLRVELDEQRRKIYEIGHDTLVGPIEEAARARREAEEQEALAAEARRAEEAERERLRLEAERQAEEKRKIEAARRRNILVGLSALALLLFAFWKNFEAGKAQEKAEEMTRLAQENKEKADLKETVANLAQARADLLLDSVNVAKTRIDQAKKDLKLAENATEAQKQLARKNLLEAEQAGAKVVYFILDNARQQIKTLDYEKADTTLQSAVSLVSGRPATSPLGALRPLVAEALAEPAFFFHETGQADRADRLAADIARLLDVREASFRNISKLPALDHTMRHLRERYYGEFAEIPGGQFELYDYDSSAHYTAILSLYRMAATETTWWQYHLFCKATGYRQPEKPGWGSDGDNPVVNVSWYDAVVYCNWRSDREGKEPAYRIDSVGRSQRGRWIVEVREGKNGYRLPTEAEWQYAATNAGRDAFEYSGSDNLDEVGWYGYNSGSRTRPVMGKTPNRLDLYDLSGNVWEWCWDWRGEYPKGEQTNYRGPESGSSRVLRGGSWNNNNNNCSVRRRNNNNPGNRNNNNGFRLAQHSVVSPRFGGAAQG